MTHTLSFSEVDEIVCKNLACLDPQKYQVVREDQGHSILYTIAREGAFLGRYRVSRRPDGGVDYGSIQGDGPSWDMIWESMLFTAIKRAEGNLTAKMEQSLKERLECYRQRLRAEGNQSQEEGYLPLNWRELSRRIDVLNKTQGLGMVKETVQGPGTNGTTGWFTPGNGIVFIHGENDLSFIEYQTLDKKPAMPETLEIWQRLREWLAMEQPTGAAVDGGQGEQAGEGWLEQVRDVGNDREIIRLWGNGFTAYEISCRVGRCPKTITKKITELRKKYGAEIVKYRRK
jgi:hypothetical protein